MFNNVLIYFIQRKSCSLTTFSRSNKTTNETEGFSQNLRHCGWKFVLASCDWFHFFQYVTVLTVRKIPP